MAKQTGIHTLEGTIGNMVYYRIKGKDVVRRKSEPDKKRLKTHVNYVKTRKCNDSWREASAIVKNIYRLLPKEKKVHGLWGKLTGRATQLIYKGVCKDDVMKELQELVG